MLHFRSQRSLALRAHAPTLSVGRNPQYRYPLAVAFLQSKIVPILLARVILAGIDSGRMSVHLPDSETVLELVTRLPNRGVETAPDNKKSDNLRPPSDKSLGSPVDIVTRYFAAVHHGLDAAAYALVTLHEVPSLKKLPADPLKGPEYRNLAGRIGAMSELSRSETSAFVYCMVDPNTPSATPITIGLMKDPITRRWVLVEF
jgi:hypothetical protein